MKTLIMIAITSVALLTTSCRVNQSNKEGSQLQAIFPKGEAGPAEHFTGRAWNMGLVDDDTVYKKVIGNVYFEPGEKRNWNIHPSGQILIITNGVGYSQEKGQ